VAPPVIGGYRRCEHSLEEFNTPNGYFSCDLCRTRMDAWRKMWGCRQCNYDECEDCYALGDHAKEENHVINAVPPAKKLEAKPKAIAWACASCTFDNELERMRCEVCGEERQMPEVTIGDIPTLLCSICCDARCEVAFLECGHCVTCECCANSLFAQSDKSKLCPICRKQLKSKPLRIYFA